MKNILGIILFLLPTCGVFGADEVQILPVEKGDSVTLNTYLTQVEGTDVIWWMFGDLVITKMAGNEILYISEADIFRGNLNLDSQTGSLTIKNIRTEHTGLYKAVISHNSVISKKLFIVTLLGVFSAKTNVSMSVMEGQPVTLTLNFGTTDIMEINRLIWKFLKNGNLPIAKLSGNGITYPPNGTEIFRDRLKLDNQTGSLTILKIKTSDAGLYKAEINRNNLNSYFFFNITVNVPGLSPGAAAGISFVVLLVFAGAGAFAFYHRHKLPDIQRQSEMHQAETSELQSLIYEEKIVSVKDGESVTLRPDAVIQRDDRILWMFAPQETLIAKVNGNTREIYTGDVADGRFTDRLRLDSTTGSVTITNTASEHVGVYKLKIISSTGTSYQTFRLTFTYKAKIMSVKEGESVILQPDAVIQRDDQILWTFGPQETLINKVNTREICTGDGADGRFTDRLKLDSTTGSLKITNATSEYVGVYKLKIINSTGTSYQTFIFTFTHEAKIVSVKEGESVILQPDAVIQRDDQILWTFGSQETLINKVNTREICTGDGADGRFTDRLKLDSTTGSLKITNATSEYVGVYKLKIISSTGTSYQTFIFTLTHEEDVMSVTEGNSVTLDTDTEIQKGDLILWMFGDDNSQTQIAKMEKATKTFNFPDRRFKNKLNLDKKTGSLTITDIKNYHTGLYKLQISNSSRATTSKNFKVLVNYEKVSVMEKDAVTLKVHVKIGKKDEIQWQYGEDNALIAEIKGKSRDIHKYDVGGGRFKDRLMVDDKTGSLTIKNTRPEHTGLYTLLINSSKGRSYKHFLIFVRASMILGKQGNSTTLNVNAELQRDDLILWLFGDEDNLIAQMNGETTETTFTKTDERFRNRLLLDKMTGSLTIRNITSEHSGAYKVHISSSNKPIYSSFRVFVFGESGPNTVSVMAGESLILITNFNVEQDEKLQWTFEGVMLASGMNGDVSKTSYGNDERFRGRLELHHQTASLTVKNTRSSDSGVYQLNFLKRHKKHICLKVDVTISEFPIYPIFLLSFTWGSSQELPEVVPPCMLLDQAALRLIISELRVLFWDSMPNLLILSSKIYK